ncbi:MAG: glycogen debranching enzyme family protein [Spirochaetes bacterium]|nr:glycogen debranching enzyme family protein [Spirochaetota bacterium]
MPGEIPVDRGIGESPDVFTSREWLETNRLGAHASSTLCDAHSRKYHGLLVAPIPGGGKHVFLSKFEAELVIDGEVFALSSSFFPNTMCPDSWKRLARFVQGPVPRWLWSEGPWQTERQLLLVEKSNTLLLRYDHRGPGALLRLRPFLAYRDMHHLARENGFLSGAAHAEPSGVRFEPYASMPPLRLAWSAPGEFKAAPDWYRGFEYPVEAMRGFESHEDLFTPGVLEIPLRADEPLFLSASIESNVEKLPDLWAAEFGARQDEWNRLHGDPAGRDLAPLKYHGRHFLVTCGKPPSICAGYPWFAEWGRDAMIALPGLTLYSGRDALALDILATFAGARRDGLIPNYLNADGRHAYNSVDASLWFFAAVQEYLARTGDHEGVLKYLFAAMADILDAFRTGRAPQVQCRENGLLWVGNPGTQLTWMDACVHGRPVTPRHGMAVELNALWYNALQFFLEFCNTARKPAPPALGECALRAKQAFWKTFSAGPWPWLADTVNEHGADASLRPNQIFAVSLPHSPLSREQQALVVEAVARNLVTPVGLRTLAPGDPRYLGRYEGDGEARDRAYHQGTVWPWLVGAYVAAALKTAPDRKAAARGLSETFAPLFSPARTEYGVGGIAEIYDGNAPHRPAGCITQAWSVGEIIRARTFIQEALS